MKIKNLNLGSYYSVEYNILMEMTGEPPIYTLHAQFRNTRSGAVRWFKRKFIDKNVLTGKELDEFLLDKLANFIQEKENDFTYSFIPYESAIYDFPMSGKMESWHAKCFYDEKEKETHRFYYKLAPEREKEKLKLR